MLLSYKREDNPDIFLHSAQELLKITHVKSTDVQVRVESYEEIQMLKHWSKLHNNRVFCVTSSKQILTLCSLFLKTDGTLKQPSSSSTSSTSSTSVTEGTSSSERVQPVSLSPLYSPTIDVKHVQSSTPNCEQRIALILHCEKYAYRRAKYVNRFRPVLEDMGFSCVFVLGYTGSVGPLKLIEDNLYVPVKEGYERCNLKMYHAYEWCKQFSPTSVLKIDDDITILNDRVFRTLAFQSVEDYIVVDVTSCGDGMSTSHVKKASDVKTPAATKRSTYGVGGMHMLSSRALNSLTYEDMTETIFEDLNMGIAKQKHKWSMHNLGWIRKKVMCYEIQK